QRRDVSDVAAGRNRVRRGTADEIEDAGAAAAIDRVADGRGVDLDDVVATAAVQRLAGAHGDAVVAGTQIDRVVVAGTDDGDGGFWGVAGVDRRRCHVDRGIVHVVAQIDRLHRADIGLAT